MLFQAQMSPSSNQGVTLRMTYRRKIIRLRRPDIFCNPTNKSVTKKFLQHGYCGPS
jgi:hypothetical protein